jgi:hypothetical protein
MNYRKKYDLYTTICGAQNRAVSETGQEPHAVFTLSTGQFDTVARPSENNLLGSGIDMGDDGMVRNEQFAF